MKINTKGRLLVGLLAATVLVAACTPPGSGANGGTDTTEATPALSLDNSSGQAMLVTQTGERINIESVEGTTLVRCAEATDLLILDSGTTARHAGGQRRRVRALVIGQRDDGLPGIWEVHQDNSIHSVAGADGADGTSAAPDCPEFGGIIHGFFGWRYEIMDIVSNSDGSEIVATGEASIPGDIRIWRWRVPGPASVGVYWVLRLTESGRYSFKEFARVIGEPNENAPLYSDGDPSHEYSWVWHFLRLIFSSLRLFFLDWYDVYLETVQDDSLQHASTTVVAKGDTAGGTIYTVLGTSQDGVSSKATIDTEGMVVVEPDEVPITTYDRIVVQMFDPKVSARYVPLSINLGLYQADPPKKKMIVETGATSYAWPELAYAASMKTGDAFIIEVDYNDADPFPGDRADDEDYAIRVLAIAGVAPTPPDQNQPGVDDTGNENDASPDPWSGGIPMQIGLDEIKFRDFADGADLADVTDVDYFRLVLP